MTLIMINRPLSRSEIYRRQASHIVTSWGSRVSEWRQRARSRRELRQLGVHCAESRLDRIEVGRVRRQIEQRGRWVGQLDS